jgi:hypothetical protein
MLTLFSLLGADLDTQLTRTQLSKRLTALLAAIILGAVGAALPAALSSQLAGNDSEPCNYKACDLTDKYCFTTDLAAHCIGPLEPPEAFAEDDDIPACSSTRCKSGGGPS